MRSILRFVIFTGMIFRTFIACPDSNAFVKEQSAGFALLENARLRVAIDTNATSSTFGMVMSFFDKKSNTTIGNAQLFHLHAGSDAASEMSTLRCGADTVALECNTFGSMKLTARFEYALVDAGIVLQLKMFGAERTDLHDGLTLDFQTSQSRITCSNHFPGINEWNLDAMEAYTVDFDQILQFSDSSSCLTFFVRNPFHSHFGLNANGKKKHTFSIFKCVPAFFEQTGPNFFSTIDANDTIIRRIEVYPVNSIDAPVFFSEHPKGFTNTVAMFWDELPNRDNWAFMTTDTATDTKFYRFFARLLNEDPAVKMGFVLLPDRLLYRPYSTWRNWAVCTPFIFPDTVEEYEGGACIYLPGNVGDTATDTSFGAFTDTVMVYQAVHCKPNTNFTLTYAVKTRGVVGFGALGEVYDDTGILACGTPLLGDNPWRRVGFNFTTSTIDTAVYIGMSLKRASGIALFDDVRLTSDNSDTNLLLNGGFEDFIPGIIYDNPRRHWSDAHGQEQIVTKAPQSYLKFLQRMENHTMLYGWEDRVEIGCHGYHHSPSLFEPDPQHEFQYYDTVGDRLSMKRIFSEFYQMGLTNASLRFWRSPGFAVTKSLMDLLIDSGFVFLDATPGGGAPTFGAFMLQRGAKRIWSTKNMWWADYHTGNDASTAPLFSTLAQGHFATIGGHPELIFSGDLYVQRVGSYQRLKGIISAMKDSCPSLGFVFPDEYADNADAMYKLRIESVEREGANIVFRFRGRPRAGNTLVYWGRCDKVSLNGAAIPFTAIKAATYAVLPSDSSGAGTVVFENAVNNELLAIRQQKKGGNPAPVGISKAGSHGTVAVYTLRGQRVCVIQNATQREACSKLTREFQRLHCGVYILKSMTPDGKGHNKPFVFPR